MTKIIGCRVTNEFDRSIRILAAQIDMNRSEFMRIALSEKLEREISERKLLNPHQAVGENVKVDYGD